MSKLLINSQLLSNDFDQIFKNRNSFKSKVWDYFGYLKPVEPNLSLSDVIQVRIPDNKYTINDVIWCFECKRIHGFLRSVQKYAPTTSTEVLSSHLRTHRIQISNRSLENLQNNPKTRFYVSLVIFCCLDDVPLQVVAKKGFNYFLKSNNLPYTVTPAHLRNNVLPIVDDFFKTKVKTFIENNFEFGCLGVDIWLDKNTKLSYIGLVLFFIDKNFKFQKILLDICPFDEQQSGQNIRFKIEQVLETYSINSRDLLFISDAGANVLAACRDFNHQICISHALHNLIMRDAIHNCSSNGGSLKNLLKKCKDIYNFLRSRKSDLKNMATEIIESIMNNFDILILEERYPEFDFEFQDSDTIIQSLESFKTIKNSIPTRWGSLELSLSSIESNHSLVNQVLTNLNKQELKLNNFDLMLMKDLIKHLNLISIEAKILSADKEPVINEVFISFQKIKSFFHRSNDDQFGYDEIGEFRELVRSNLESRFPINDYHKLGLILEPRIKNKAFVQSVLNEDVTTFLSRKISEFSDSNDSIDISYSNSTPTDDFHSNSTPADEFNSNSTPISNKRRRIEEIEIDLLGSVDNRSTSVDLEIQTYLNLGLEDIDSLEYWKTKSESKTFPNLSKLFKRIGCYQISNTFTERLFSSAGLKTTKKNTKLLARNLESMIFIKENYKLFEPSLIAEFDYDLITEDNEI